jgi:UDP:flavonoid glycosyltransferase YjiC (YdhE family)
MRVAFVAPPFSGHLHPILAVARRVARDHDVIVASTPAARARIEGAGLDAHAFVDATGDAAIAAIANTAEAVRSDPLALARQLRANLALMRRFRIDFAAFCERTRPDLVIADFVIPAAGFVATELGIPWWTALASPCVMETRDGPPAYLGGWSPRPGPLGPARDALGRGFIRVAKHGFFGAFRGSIRATGLTGIYRPDGTEAVYSPACVLALGFREIEFASQFAPAVRFVGPGYYSPVPYDGTRPAFGRGTNVLVTIGTHVPWFKERMAAATRATARRLRDVTFHFSAGELTGTRSERSDNFTRLPYVRYRTEIARYDLVVHHAGAGIANECLRAGVPSIAFPLDYDQFDIAARLAHFGLAHRLRDLRLLPAAVRAALADDGLRAACRAFARVAERYDAPETVARLIDRSFRHS